MADALTHEQYQKGQSSQAALQRELSAEQVRGFKESFGAMSSELRSMTTAITESRIASGEGGDGAKSTHGLGTTLIIGMALSVLGLLAGQAAVTFGVMAPMFILIQETKADVDIQDGRMRLDDVRERTDAAALAALRAEVDEMGRSHDRDQTAVTFENLLENMVDRIEKIEYRSRSRDGSE